MTQIIYFPLNIFDDPLRRICNPAQDNIRICNPQNITYLFDDC